MRLLVTQRLFEQRRSLRMLLLMSLLLFHLQLRSVWLTDWLSVDFVYSTVCSSACLSVRSARPLVRLSTSVSVLVSVSVSWIQDMSEFNVFKRYKIYVITEWNADERNYLNWSKRYMSFFHFIIILSLFLKILTRSFIERIPMIFLKILYWRRWRQDYLHHRDE